MPPTMPLPLIGCPEDHPSPEAKSEIEAEIKVMKVQILAMAPRLWRQRNADLLQEVNMDRKRRNRHEIAKEPMPLRPHTDFAIQDHEHKEGTLIRDTQGRVRSIEWKVYSCSLAKSADQDRAIVEGPKKYSRKDAVEAFFKICRKMFKDIQEQAQETTNGRATSDLC